MLHIYAWDPGLETGHCHLSIHEGEVGLFTSGQADIFQVGNMLLDNLALKAAASKPEHEIVFVCESYIQRPGKSEAPWSLETIGLLRYFAHHYHIEFVLQTPSQAKSLIRDKVIKKAGLWVPNQKHAMDAVRHGLYYLITQKGMLKECLIPSELK